MAYAKTKSLKQLTLAGVAAIALGQGSALAQSAEKIEFEIVAQDLGSALNEFGVQSGKEVYYREADIAGKTANRVDGSYSPTEAINILLDDTGVPYQDNGKGTILVGEAYIRQASLETESQPFRVASLAQEDDISRISEDDNDGEIDDAPSRDVIIVTGTNIRGIAPESSPTLTFDREDVQISGAGTAQDFIQTLPQNFSGGSNQAISSLPNDVNAGQNFGFGSSVNLRGLGSGSTLVLLNGHRLAPSSTIGDFVDISLIPASAIERVEVLTDGASSIYGADAVAGVVNFVLRDDFDGVEASYRYGTVTQGNLDEHRTAITGGANWDSGNALLSYEFFSQTNLSVADRSFSQNAPRPNDLLPSQRRHSVLATASQELSADLEVFTDFTFSSREANRKRNDADEITTTDATTETVNIAAGASWNFKDSWFLDLVGTYSDLTLDRTVSGDRFNERRNDSSLWTADIKTSGDLFALPAGEVKLAIGGHFRSEDLVSVARTVDLVAAEADREVFAAFGEIFIPIVSPESSFPWTQRLELNISGRYSDFSDFGSTANPKIGLLWSPVENLRLRGSYSTSFNPPPLGRVGANDGTAFAYPTALLNSIIGLTPGDPSIADVVGLAISGTSPNLDAEESEAFTIGLDFDRDWGSHRLNFTTTYFDIEFEGRLGSTPRPDNRPSFDVPNIAIVSPDAFPDGTVLFNPSAAQIQDVLDAVGNAPVMFGGADPADAAFIDFHRLTRNLSLTNVRGFDFNADYIYEADFGQFLFGIHGTFLKDFKQQAAVTTDLIEQLNTQFNPIDLNLRGRMGYAHRGFSGNIFLNYADSYRSDNSVDAVKIDSWTTFDLNLSYDTREIAGNAFLNNTVFRLSVQNLFDDSPPETPGVPSLGIFGFDPTNASPLNRFVAFEITKRF